MTQEDKELLLKDLCARLPYDVKVKRYVYTTPVDSIQSVELFDPTWLEELYAEEAEFKPYLFPLSSMTEKILEELNANGFFKYRDTIANVSHLENKDGINEEIYTYIDIECISFLIEYFHSHHIDYRGLIEKGLAIDATGLNIY